MIKSDQHCYCCMWAVVFLSLYLAQYLLMWT